MVTRASSRGAGAAHEVFVLPELKHPRRRDLRVLILPDGNKRSDPRQGGYARGAQKVVEIAEHLARRPDVAVLMTGIVSPENIAARSDGFFAHLRDGFLHLAARIDEQGTLIAAGIRAELCGDLRPLRDRGGSAVALADAIEVVIAKTSHVTTPALRLLFGVGYPSTTPRDLDIDLVLRTGLEDEAALRLSGLCSHPIIANYAMTKLWPEVTRDDVDAIIEAAKQRRTPGFSMGYDPATIVDLARAIARAPLARPVRTSLATHAPPQAMRDAIDRLNAEPAFDRRVVAVTCAGDAARTPGARHELHVVFGGPHAQPPDDYASMLAPGQHHPLLVLPEGQYGYATIHPCEATPAGIIEGIRVAERFSATHVALRGAERDLDGPGARRARGAEQLNTSDGWIKEGIVE